MEAHGLLKRRTTAGGSIASLLASTGRPAAQARSEFVAVAGAAAGTDLLVLEPNSPQFVGLTQGFNRRWLAPNCAVIFVPLTEQGAQIALAKAVGFGPGHVRVRGGGHCYEDFVFSEQTLALIDVSLLDEIGFDAQQGVYYAQSGGTNWDLYRRLYWHFGLTLPAGSCYSVGLGGHICGGGYGLMSREFGLTVDWLSGVHVVTVDRNRNTVFKRVNRQSAPGPDQDLFWAHTGGGGGNFGLITRYEFATLPKAPQRAEIYTMSWSWADTIVPQGGAAYLKQIIASFEVLTRTMPPSAFALLKLAHEAAGAVSLVVQYAYDGAPGSSTILPLLEATLNQFGIYAAATPHRGTLIGHPVYLANAIPYQDLTWFEAVQTLNGSGPNQKGKYKSAYMRKDFPDDQIATIYRYLRHYPTEAGGEPIDMSQSLLQVDSYGGKINTVAPHATAVWQRSSLFKLQYQTYWQDVESGPSPNGEAHIRWIGDFYRDMYAASGGVPDPAKDPSNNVDGCYINYPDTDLNQYGGREGALRLYYGGNLPRLTQAKTEWDPLDYFQNNQSIVAA
ncbi:BBE domain-containing protein [Bradyrhizobium ontarionense]|uniref:BBE domain-containing protein n=1 Tax=Bradyrhizobium ontarionense TaxID=2898149 RepID=A0ABY3RIL3_9BRAD|nr:BBE domain-containing protein [Bradyrhizobium sp. A19]UFZ07191.1 BBE domain-containing protein [Bradyrhizobium sp. A19]